MEQEITNANDVTLTVKGADTSKAGADGKLMVADFDYEKAAEKEPKHGCGNHDPIGVTHGNNTYSLSLSLEGEDAILFDEMNTDSPKGPDLQVTIRGQKYKWVIHHFWPDTENFSGSDGDAVEYSLEGICSKPSREILA